MGTDMIVALQGLGIVHDEFSSAAAALEQGIGRPICMEKCGRCCEHNTPYATALEAVNAASRLVGQGKLAHALDLAEGWLTDSTGMRMDGIPTGVIKEEIRKEWDKVRLDQCPFLTEDKRCGIWDVRPLSCRAAGVTRDLTPICPRPLGKGERDGAPMVVNGEPIRQRWEALVTRIRQGGPDLLVHGFMPALLLRAADPARFRKAVERAPSAKLIGTEVDPSLLWQEQLDDLRRGVAPELVAMQGKTPVPA